MSSPVPAYNDSVLASATVLEHRLKHLLQADMLPRFVRMQANDKSASFDIQFRDDDGGRRLLFQSCLKDQGIAFDSNGQRIHVSANTHLASFFNALTKALQAFGLSIAQLLFIGRHCLVIRALLAAHLPQELRLLRDNQSACD